MVSQWDLRFTGFLVYFLMIFKYINILKTKNLYQINEQAGITN